VQSQHQLKESLLHALQRGKEIAVVQPPAIGQAERGNELLMFLKPEILGVLDRDCLANSVDLIWEKLSEFGASVEGIVLVGGQTLESKKSMDQHYGAINVLSKTASTGLNAVDRRSLYDALAVTPTDYPLFGGHEFLAAHPSFTPGSLDTLWFTKKAEKIRSGFYVQAYKKDDEKFILVNGFHPAQLAHFTEPSHRIALMLLHSDTGWAILRDQMIGDTFPERAVAGSIRGELHARPAHYGFEEVTIANNGVHLSAGPFEAMFEIDNFFGSLLGSDISSTPPRIVNAMRAAGISQSQAYKAKGNPDVDDGAGETTDLFDATEHMDTEPAVALYLSNIAG
jgi:hypothetical protein